MIRVLICTFYLTLLSFISQTQINERFVLRAAPDNGWYLNFEKNGVYTYYHFNMFSERPKTLDSGNYVLQNDTLFLTSHFKSDHKESLSSFYLYHEFYFKKKDKICTLNRYREKKLLFRKRVRYISKEKKKKNDFLC